MGVTQGRWQRPAVGAMIQDDREDCGGHYPHGTVGVAPPSGAACRGSAQAVEYLDQRVSLGGAFVFHHRPDQQRFAIQRGEAEDTVAAMLRQGGIDEAFRPVGGRVGRQTRHDRCGKPFAQEGVGVSGHVEQELGELVMPPDQAAVTLGGISVAGGRPGGWSSWFGAVCPGVHPHAIACFDGKDTRTEVSPAAAPASPSFPAAGS